MDIFGLLLASTLACQPPIDNGQIGLWESAATSRGGIGNNIEFKSDGSYISAIMVRVDLNYDVKEGMLFIAKNKGEPVSYENGTKIKIMNDAYMTIGPDGKTEVRSRIGATQSNTIVGEYKYRHYTGAIAYEQFTKGGLLRLRIPMGSDSGCYSIDGAKIEFIPKNKGSTSIRYRIESGKLILDRDKGTTIYNFVPEDD